MQLLGVGISAENRMKIINEVEIVFHAAADVRFDESLKEATEINIRGTREIMLLSQDIVNLNNFIYVSTAFCTPSFNVRESCKLIRSQFLNNKLRLKLSRFSLQNTLGS